MNFSTRYNYTQQAEEWCREHCIPITPFNIVVALDNLGLLSKEAALALNKQKVVE